MATELRQPGVRNSSGLVIATTGSKGAFRMNTLAGGQTYAIANRFDKAVKLIRSALAKTELGVVGELDTTGTFGKEPGKKAERSSILLVDCPLIVFEAQALDRAAGVFFPLHVLILADGGQTWACTASAAGILNARLPSGADGPMERLQARVAVALESVSLRAGPNHPEQIGEE